MENIKEFIEKYISSVEQLEALLILMENHHKGWTAADLGRRLMTQEGSVNVRLSDLEAKGLLRSHRDAGQKIYHFAPSTQHTESVVKDLGEFYKMYRLKVFQLIYDRSNESIRVFSDAFRLWKRREKGEE